jgi:hypothetical protein
MGFFALLMILTLYDFWHALCSAYQLYCSSFAKNIVIALDLHWGPVYRVPFPKVAATAFPRYHLFLKKAMLLAKRITAGEMLLGREGGSCVKL